MAAALQAGKSIRVFQVYFKQFCRKCQKEFNPYRVEDITCHVSCLSIEGF